MEKEAVLPKNVRQIGDIQGNRRIYMEDYVMTYIHGKEQQEERGFLGVFLGEKQESGEGTLLFIRGLVEVPREDKEAQAAELTQMQEETFETQEETDEGKKGAKAEAKEEPKKENTLLEECRKYFGESEIQGCCVIGEYPVKRMERLSAEIPGPHRLLYHLQEQEETLYWTEEGRYEQIPGYFVFYEQNEEMQEYMAETCGGEKTGKEKVSDKAIRTFREKIRKKDKARTAGMLRLASSFFVVAALLIGAVAVNRIGALRDTEAVAVVTESEVQSQVPETRYITAGTGAGDSGQEDAVEVSDLDAAAVIQNGIGDASLLQDVNGAGDNGLLQDVNGAGDATQSQGVSGVGGNDQLQDVNGAVETAQLGNGNAALQTGETKEGNGDEIPQAGVGGETSQSESGEKLPTGSETSMAQAEDGAVEASSRQVRAAYVIREGDTLADICQTYYGNLDKLAAICEANGIEDADMIIPGQKIVLP